MTEFEENFPLSVTDRGENLPRITERTKRTTQHPPTDLWACERHSMLLLCTSCDALRRRAVRAAWRACMSPVVPRETCSVLAAPTRHTSCAGALWRPRTRVVRTRAHFTFPAHSPPIPRPFPATLPATLPAYFFTGILGSHKFKKGVCGSVRVFF